MLVQPGDAGTRQDYARVVRAQPVSRPAVTGPSRRLAQGSYAVNRVDPATADGLALLISNHDILASFVESVPLRGCAADR
jgi:hypothetical protein